MPLRIDNLDGEQLGQAAKLLARENERLARQILELKQQLAPAEDTGAEQREVLAELARQLAARNRKHEMQNQTGHGPSEQPELAVTDRVHVLNKADRVCPSCGGHLEEMVGRSADFEEVDVFERQFVLVRHKRRACGRFVETAPGPEKLSASGRYSIEFAVNVAIATYADHWPLERQVRVMKRQGLVVDSQTLWDQINALARHLRPAHLALRSHILSQPCNGADETFWRMTDGNGDNKRWRTWAVVAPNAVSYRILGRRSAAAAAEVLGDYSGTLLCDG